MSDKIKELIAKLRSEIDMIPNSKDDGTCDNLHDVVSLLEQELTKT